MPIWFQARCLHIKTKRQQAAALQTLRAYQRPLHPRRRAKNHWGQRHDPMGPIWGQTRCLRCHADMVPDTLFAHRKETKRQQAAALETLRAYQRPLHPRQRVRNHRDQRALPCDGVAGHISQPGVAEGPGGCRCRGVACQATLVPATPGWEKCGLNETHMDSIL